MRSAVATVDARKSHVPRQRRVVGRTGFFALSFGTIIGSAWLVVFGHWLEAAGPGGALLGFALGATVVVLIACCYAELAARLPNAGGEVLYALQGVGTRTAFLVGWFLTLDAIAVCAFEGIALAIFVTKLIPAAAGPIAYHSLGSDVTGGSLAMGIGAAAVLGYINIRGLGPSITFQRIATYSFLGVLIVLLAAGLYRGEASNLQPWFASLNGGPWWVGTAWIFATCALFLSGFQVALYTIEERKVEVPVRSVVITMIWGLLAAAAFYCVVVLSTGSMLPWVEVVESELPAVTAFAKLGNARVLQVIVLGAACVSLLKTWNAVIIFGSQLLVAMSRHGFVPGRLFAVDPVSGTPVRAILFMTGTAMAFMLLGQSAVIPIVNTASICIAMTFAVSLAALIRLRRRAARAVDKPAIAFEVPGGVLTIRIATAGALTMATFALLEPALRTREIPIEWMLLAGWGVIGAAFWKFR